MLTFSDMKPKFVALFLAIAGLGMSGKQSHPIRVGSSPVVSSAGIYIAQEKGYFKELGLDVEITTFKGSGAQLTAPLAAGEMEVGGGNYTAGLFNSMLQGAKVKLVADKGHLEKGHGYLALMVRADHVTSGRFKTYKDLKGFKMGVTALNGVSQEILADRFLKLGGLTGADVSFVKMSYSEMNAAFASRTLDATIQLEPFVTLAETKGLAKRIGDACEAYCGQQSAGIFYSAQFIEKRREDAVKFMIAYLRGVRDYEAAFTAGTDREKIAGLLGKYIEGVPADLWARMVPVGLNPDGFIDKKALAEDLEWYRSRKYLNAVPPINEVVDHSFIEEALKRIGAKQLS